MYRIMIEIRGEKMLNPNDKKSPGYFWSDEIPLPENKNKSEKSEESEPNKYKLSNKKPTRKDIMKMLKF